MNFLQRNLDSIYHDPIHLKKNIIRACRSNSAFSNGLINPLSESFALINNLYNFIVNYKTIHFSNQIDAYLQNNNNSNDEHETCETYFTTRQYRNKRDFRDRFKDNFRSSNNFRSFRIFGISFRSATTRKCCFVCEKNDCGFINHTQQEREASKRKFMNQQSRFKSKSDFLQRGITKIEKTLDDDEIIAFFEEISLKTFHDFDPISATTFESYFTFIKQFRSSNVVMNISVLIDYAFKHGLTSSDNIGSSPNSIASTLYIFSTFNNTQYNNTEFKGLLIDSDASTMSINDMSQLKALQRLNASILLNKSLVNSAIFIFDIDSTSSIETAILRIFMKAIIFHIVSINTSFLLCFVDMD